MLTHATAEGVAAAIDSDCSNRGRESLPVGRPDFKPGVGHLMSLCGFDSHSLPPKEFYVFDLFAAMKLNSRRYNP